MAPMALLLYYIILYFTSPLQTIPGPFWSRFTNLWRFIDQHNATQPSTQRRLHEAYGPVVRIGPNLVSLNYPNLLKIVYSTRRDFSKVRDVYRIGSLGFYRMLINVKQSSFYGVNDVRKDGKTIENIFSTRNNVTHRSLIRPISHLYSVKNILNMEPLIDKAIFALCRQLEERFTNTSYAGRSMTCNISHWIEYCKSAQENGFAIQLTSATSCLGCHE